MRVTWIVQKRVYQNAERRLLLMFANLIANSIANTSNDRILSRFSWSPIFFNNISFQPLAAHIFPTFTFRSKSVSFMVIEKIQISLKFKPAQKRIIQ